MNGNTILDATNKLIDFFQKEEVFILNKDIKRVILISLDEEIDKAILLKALTGMEEKKLISRIDKSDSKIGPVFVLTQPFYRYAQSVELSYPTVQGIAVTINRICDNLKTDQGRVNPLNITEGNINDLVLLIENLIKNQQEEE